MTAPDTSREVVEAMIRILDREGWCDEATMFRALLDRAEAAEQEGMGDYYEGFEEGFKAGEEAQMEAGRRAIKAEDEAIRARGEGGCVR